MATLEIRYMRLRFDSVEARRVGQKLELKLLPEETQRALFLHQKDKIR